jgi:multiple sugar transport system permease protein
VLGRRISGTGLRVADVPVWLIGMIVVLIWAAPFIWMVSTSLKPRAEVMT